MRRYFLTMALFLAGVMWLNANPVDMNQAQGAASKFFEARTNLQFHKGMVAEMVLAHPDGAYYVFSAGAKGFVMIAGDDAYRPVIGYSTESSFDPDNIPPALVDYLEGIAYSIQQLRNRGNAMASPMVAAEWESVLNHGRLISRFGGREGEYFCQTQWNQTYPYNYCCPEDPQGSGGHAIVGCLATAMSQLMRFWAMPAQGIGSHCYTHEDYGQICADFGATVYDWDNMPNKFDENAPEVEKLAVGTLCFHCGVTIDIGYGPDGTGGASSPIPGAMHQYFDYSEANVQRSRNDFETETWKRMVREQFDMGWPMYYGGCQDGGCHAFVCDGYDDHDMYHFNLGWGGGSDGWYLIDEAPYTSPADAMFNFVPSAIYDITPSAPTELTVEVPVEPELRSVLRWTNPTTSLDNTPLASIEQVVVKRNGQVIQVLTDMAPGQTVEFEDTEIPFYNRYDYEVYAQANGRYGKHAYELGVTVGPTCEWKVVMSTSNYQGWNGGYVSVYNNASREIAQCSVTSSNPSVEKVDLPLGRLSFGWTAPQDSLESMSITIRDAQNQVVYSFSGPSSQLATGTFLEINNTCGNDLACDMPENLLATEVDDHVLFTWDAVGNEGYGYNIYRDGQLIRLVPAGTETSFFDEQAVLGGYCYQVTVLCESGESGGMSNESCVSVGPCYPPRNLDYELTSNYKIELTWDAPEPNDGLTGYYLYRKEGNGEYHRIKLLGPDMVSFKDNTVNVEGDYYYRLYAYYKVPDCISAPASRKYQTNVFELHAYYSPTCVVENGDDVKVYPNPAHGVLRVEAESLTHVAAFNALGQCVLNEAAMGDAFDWQHVAKGVYVMRIDTEKGVFFTKIVAL